MLLFGADDRVYQHPNTVTSWCDDLKKWPQLQTPHIIYYLLEKKACDLREVKAFRSMQSYTYLQSGWVGTVLLHKIDKNLVLLKCEVQASQSLKTMHNAWVCCESNGGIRTSGCSCMAGRGKVCSHVGALLWKIDLAVSSGLTGETCTDNTAAWNRGTKRNLEPAALVDINFKMKKRTVDTESATRTLPSIPWLRSDAEFIQFYKDSPFQELVNIPGTLMHETLTAPERELPVPSDEPATATHVLHENSQMTLPDDCPPCLKFYTKYVSLSSASMSALEAATRTQNSSLWHTSRRLRITASNIKRIPKRATTSTQKALLSLTTPTFHGNAATRHGLQSEKVARQKFEEHFGMKVELHGTHVCKDYPWLSATPDGVIDSHNAVLEIKCPFVEDCSVLIANGKYDVVKRSGSYVLLENGPNSYYSQVQFAMLCVQKNLCFFYVWSLKSAVLVRVPFNAKYIEDTMPRLQKFYFCNMLPCLEKMEVEGKLDLTEYKQVCEK